MIQYDLTSIKAYRDHPGMHYSLLSQLADGPEKVGAREESDSLSFGSLVDCKLFTPLGEEEQFIVMPLDYKLSDAMKKFADTIISYHRLNEKTTYQDVPEWLEDAKEQSEFKISLDRVVKRFEEEGKGYVEFMLTVGDRQVISPEMNIQATGLANLVKVHPFSRKYFTDRPGVDLYYQKPIFWEDEALECEGKCLLDIMEVDHNAKTIEPVDFKTLGMPVRYFRKNYFKYKYYYQDPWYSNGVLHLRDREYPDYKVLPFKFMAASLLSNYPLIYIFRKSLEESNAIWNGGVLDNWRIKGIRELVADYQWYLQNGFETDREASLNNGLIETEFLLR